MNSLYICICLGDRKIAFNEPYFQNFTSSDSDFPNFVTMGFRQTLYKVFSSISVSNIFQPTTINFLGEKVIVQDAIFFESTKGLALEHKHDYFISLRILAPDTIVSKLKNNPKGHTLGRTIISSLKPIPLGKELNKVADKASDTFIGINWYIEPLNGDKHTEELEACQLILCTFYTVAWLMLQRINREQSSIELRPKKRGDKHDFIRSIVGTRIKILNIERFILTKNRTKNQVVKKFCESIIRNEEFLIHEKLDDAKKLHASFEQHLENYTSLEQVLSSEKTNGLLMLLSAGSISLALFSASFESVEKNTLMFNLDKLFSFPIGLSLLFPLITLIIIMLRYKFSKVVID